MNRLARNGLVVSNGQTQASDPFGKYKRETVHKVRTPGVTGQSLAERVKRAREMLRSMKPEVVSQIIEFHKDLNLFQALALAKQEGKLIVPNFVHDGILTETTDQRYLEQNYPVWTGTLIIYEEPDVPFGKKVLFQGLTFTVPEQFQGKANCALVIEYPYFELILGNNRYEIRVPDEANIRLIEDFPKKDGWYMPDDETKIPHGKEVGASSDSRHLWRLDVSSHLGLLVRVVGVVYDGRRDVFLFGDPSVRFGMALVDVGSDRAKRGVNS